MVLGARERRESPDVGEMLNVLDDEASQTIIQELDEPMTASEISDACDIPVSTTYRKLDGLTDTSLLATGTEVRADGHHTTTYWVNFGAVTLLLDESRSLTATVTRPRHDRADVQLATLWSEVREET